VLWAAALHRGRRGALAGAGARTLLAALALGAVGYSMQAGLFFAALTRVDASLLSLLLYTYPTFVTIAAIALVSTVTPIVLFFAGLGPSMAAILSTLEPPTTVALAFLAFGESLTAVQLAGGALVLGAVLTLHVRPRPALTPPAA
jgi:drug/metabolite transporter (DMT)-like permease